MNQSHHLDVLSVGDVVTDAFIKLEDDKASVSEVDGAMTITMPFGTKVPYDHAEVLEAVGNAANASVAFAKLGLNSGLVSNVGGDAWGRDIIGSLHSKKVDTRFVHINPGKVSNYHYVLWYKDERTILIKHEEYDYHWPRFRVSDVPKWVYFSSLSKNSMEYHDQIMDWLEAHPDVLLAFQPGTFQMQEGVKRLSRLYKRTAILVLNREEAAAVGGGDHADINDLFEKLHALGPQVICITDGPHGSYASDGMNRMKMPNYPDPKAPVERTGAGDAYASTFVAAVMLGKTLEEAMMWGPINSMNVVQHVGAQAGLLTVDEIKKYLDTAPDWYHPSVL